MAIRCKLSRIPIIKALKAIQVSQLASPASSIFCSALAIVVSLDEVSGDCGLVVADLHLLASIGLPMGPRSGS